MFCYPFKLSAQSPASKAWHQIVTLLDLRYRLQAKYFHLFHGLSFGNGQFIKCFFGQTGQTNVVAETFGLNTMQADGSC